jgi:hypothetical protein
MAGSVWTGTVWLGVVGQVNNLEEAMKEERKFLEQLAKRNGGMLMVDDVLNEAKDPRCVLHRHFQWDDTAAAESYRKLQARQLIQKCVVTVEKAPDVPIRAFVSLTTDQYSGGGYRMTAEVLSDDDLKSQLLHDMMVTLTKWKKQINLLDRDTADIIDQLEGIVRTKTKSKHKSASSRV